VTAPRGIAGSGSAVSARLARAGGRGRSRRPHDGDRPIGGRADVSPRRICSPPADVVAAGVPAGPQPDFDSIVLFVRGDTGETANLVQGICVRARSATATALLPRGPPLRLVLSGDAKDPPDLRVKLSGDYSIASSSPCDVTHRREAFRVPRPPRGRGTNTSGVGVGRRARPAGSPGSPSVLGPPRARHRERQAARDRARRVVQRQPSKPDLLGTSTDCRQAPRRERHAPRSHHRQ